MVGRRANSFRCFALCNSHLPLPLLVLRLDGWLADSFNCFSTISNFYSRLLFLSNENGLLIAGGDFYYYSM